MSYLPKGIHPIHPVRDWGKVRRFTREVEAGADYTPILTDGDELLTGTHRWVANELLKRRGSPYRIPVVELQLLPEDVRHGIEDSLCYRDYWQAQNVFEQWWHDKDGSATYHLVRSDFHDQTPETTEVAEHRDLRSVVFECLDCGHWWPDTESRYECCDGPADRMGV